MSWDFSHLGLTKKATWYFQDQRLNFHYLVLALRIQKRVKNAATLCTVGDSKKTGTLFEVQKSDASLVSTLFFIMTLKLIALRYLLCATFSLRYYVIPLHLKYSRHHK